MGLIERVGQETEGKQRVACGPLPVALAPPASCHQEIGNAADEERPSGKRSNEDGGHNPSAHRQVCNGQLCKLS